MNDITKQNIKNVGIVLADEIATNIPGISTAWKLCRALLGGVIELRQERAVEWVEFTKTNLDLFTEEIVATTAFQDGFRYCLEQYLIERNEEKRRYIKEIFLGYTLSGCGDDFPLERLIITCQQMSNQDASTLKDTDVERNDINYQIYGPTDKNIDNIFNLIHLGLLRQDISARFASDGYKAPFVTLSSFGKVFIEFIKE